MASSSDTQRMAIRERKMQAQRTLRARLEAQQQLQADAFDQLDRLAKLIDTASTDTTADLFKRADGVSRLAGELAAQTGHVRTAALRLVTDGAMAKPDVAELLGIRQAALFPRTAARLTTTQVDIDS